MALNHVKEMAKVFETYRYSHGVYTAFEDFLELAAITISNSVDKANWERREERYMEVIKKYKKDEANTFAKLIALLTMAMEHKPDDYLGRLFMELELYDSWKGQFFTTYDVAELMARMTLSDSVDDIKNNGNITVNEPTVGGGVTVIALFGAIRAKGFNAQQVMRVVAQDIDKKAVHMTYVQLSLLGINAQVLHGDTLLQEVSDVWRSPGYFFGWGHGDKLTCKSDSDVQVTSKLNQEEMEQLSLF